MARCALPHFGHLNRRRAVGFGFRSKWRLLLVRLFTGQELGGARQRQPRSGAVSKLQPLDNSTDRGGCHQITGRMIESHFYNLKHKLGYQRRCPATRLTALGCDTLWVFRDLRVRTIG